MPKKNPSEKNICTGQTSRLEYLKTKFDADLAASDYDARTPLHIAVIHLNI